MKILRLLIGERLFAPPWAKDRSFGLTVGRRRVSEAVIVGRRDEFDNVLYEPKKAGRVAWEIGANNLPLASERRIALEDVETIDILCV